MHTWVGTDSIITYNSDLSGEIVIKGRNKDSLTEGDNVSVVIPANDLLTFIGMQLRNKKISELESMTGPEYLDSLEVK